MAFSLKLFILVAVFALIQAHPYSYSRRTRTTLDTLLDAQRLLLRTMGFNQRMTADLHVRYITVANRYLTDAIHAHRSNQKLTSYMKLQTARRLLSDGISKYYRRWTRTDMNRLTEAEQLLSDMHRGRSGYGRCGDWASWSACSVTCGGGNRKRSLVYCGTVYEYRPCQQEPCTRICTTSACVKKAADIISAMKLSADPCDDFFDYACGSWIENNVIPEDQQKFDRMGEVSEKNLLKIKALLESSIKSSDIEAIRKTKILYQSCLDEDTINQLGAAPVQAYINKLGGWPLLGGRRTANEQRPLEEIIFIRGEGAARILKILVVDDLSDPSQNVVLINQASLGLPNRSYYLESKHRAVRTAYRTYMSDIVALIAPRTSIPSLNRDLDDLLAFETRLARISMTLPEKQNFAQLFKKYKLNDWAARVSRKFGWKTVVSNIFSEGNMRLTADTMVTTTELPFLKRLADLFQATPKRTIINYIIWRRVTNRYQYLSTAFKQARQPLQQALSGVTREKPAWSRCAAFALDALPNAVGRLFIDNYFLESAKQETETMIANLKNAMKDTLENADWMSRKTKETAIEKLDHMNVQVGYPDFIRNDTELNQRLKGLTIREKSYFDNVRAVEKHVFWTQFKKLGKPKNLKEFSDSAANAQARAIPFRNQIRMNAGMMQPPFYDESLPKYLNMAGIGGMIVYTMAWLFGGSVGRQFDKDGKRDDWWSSESASNFEVRKQCFIDQYSNFTVPEIKMNLNGRKTWAADMPDNAALHVAYRAYLTYLRMAGQDGRGQEPLMPGIDLNQKQMFFLTRAQMWCGHNRPESARDAIVSTSRSLPRFRSIAPLLNNPEFAKEFGCPLNSKMNPAKKCVVW